MGGGLSLSFSTLFCIDHRAGVIKSLKGKKDERIHFLPSFTFWAHTKIFCLLKQFDCHCLLVGPQRDRLLGWATVRLDILSTFSFLRGWVLCKWLVFIFFDFCSLPRTRHTKMKDVFSAEIFAFLQRLLPNFSYRTLTKNFRLPSSSLLKSTSTMKMKAFFSPSPSNSSCTI